MQVHVSMRDLLAFHTFSEVAERASAIMAPHPTADLTSTNASHVQLLASMRAKAHITLGYDDMNFDIAPLTSLQLELALPTFANEDMNINQAKFVYGKDQISIAEKAWTTVWLTEPVFRTEISLMIGSGAHIVHREPYRKLNTEIFHTRDRYEEAVRHSNMSVGLGCRLDFVYYHQSVPLNSNDSRMEPSSEKLELTVILTIHHSLMDGSSLGFLLENVERASKGMSLHGSGSCINANLGLIVKQRTHDHLARSFFQTYLKDLPIKKKPRTEHLSAMHMQSASVCRTNTQSFTPSVSIRDVAQFAQSIGVSGACVYHCAWAMAMSSFEGNDNVIIGSAFDNRSSQPEHERTIGLYMATMPLVFRFRAEDTVKDQLQSTMNDILKLREFAWARSDQIGIGPRLDNILAIQLPLPDENSSPRTMRVESFENVDFPLSMLIEADGGLRMLYDGRHFHVADVQRIGEHFKYALYNLLHEKLIGPCMKLNRLHETLLSKADFAINSDQEETIKSALERSALRFSQHPALEDCTGTILSYEQLNTKSNTVAHFLESALPNNRVVAVLGDGTARWIFSILGILKTGRVYVPLDPKWSSDRISRVCVESGASAIVFPSKPLKSEVPTETGMKVIFVDEIVEDYLNDEKGPSLFKTIHPDDELLIVFTSGSTGLPKGIPLTNRGVLALLRSCPEATMFAAPGRRIAQFMSPAFDFCNLEIFSAFLHGATLVLRDPTDTYAHLHKVNTATITPSVLTVLKPEDFPNLEIIYSTGEPIPNELANRFSKHTLLINAYGPAECSIVVSYTKLIPGDPVTIGVALPTARMYLLDESQQPVNDGVKGELYIAGVQVMQGYLRAPDMTSRHIFMDPWHVGERMYRTGDFGMRGKDCRTTYLGRVDRQVKVRGFRVELSGVEQTIMSIEEANGIAQCCATVINGTLVAFITCHPETPLRNSDDWMATLGDRLTQKLFSASIPQGFVQLEQFPLNSNGKVDTKALEKIYSKRLSAPERNNAFKSLDYVETTVGVAWRQILQLEDSGSRLRPTDNFFSLGGHSILVVLLATRLSAAFGLELTLREILPQHTFGGQVELIRHLVGTKATRTIESDPLINGKAQGLPVEELTELEKLVWRQCKIATTVTAFNIAKVLRLRGNIDPKRLVESFHQALDSDPVFRTNIVEGPAGPKRVLNRSAPRVCLVSHLDLDVEIHRGFNAECDNLVRIYLHVEGQKGTSQEISTEMRILIVASHIIGDLESLQNLLRLTSLAYNGAMVPVHKAPQHLQSSRWTRIPSASERVWWKEYLKGHGYQDNKAPLFPRLPNLGQIGYFNGTSRILQYRGKLVAALNGRIRNTGTTQHHLALATAALLLQWLSGQNNFILCAPDSARRSKLEREACGQFLDRLPIRVELPQGMIGDQITTDDILIGLQKSAHQALINAIPFSHILDSLDFPTGFMARSILEDVTLCECVVTFHPRSAGLSRYLDLNDTGVVESTFYTSGSKFPLMLEWSETGEDQWLLHVEHDTDRILPATIDAAEVALAVILEAFSENYTVKALWERLNTSKCI